MSSFTADKGNSIIFCVSILGIIDSILLLYHQNTCRLQWCLISSCQMFHWCHSLLLSFWFVGNTCVSPQLWIQQRAVISHAAAFSQTGLSSSCLAHQLQGGHRTHGGRTRALCSSGKVGCSGLFLPLEDAYFHKCWAVVL